MKKTISILLIAVLGVVAAGAIYLFPRQPKVVDTRAETKRLVDIMQERKIENPSVDVVVGLCKEGFPAACADAGRGLLEKCQHANSGASAPECAQASSMLMDTCNQGFLHSCDVIFQAVELVSLRDSASQSLGEFCDSKVPQACKTFEMALRNKLDLDRLSSNTDTGARRTRYVEVANENCDRGYFFSCLALLDEDPKTADLKRIESAEDRLRKLCSDAAEQFEKEDCLYFSEYLAITKRPDEALKFVEPMCEEGSAPACLSATRILFSTQGEASRGVAHLERSCVLNSNADYCSAFESAKGMGPLDWDKLRATVASSHDGIDKTFAELLQLRPRQTY